MQKFSKAGCLIFLVGWPLLAIAVHLYLPPAIGEARPWFAGASGLTLALGASSLWLLLTGNVATRAQAMQWAERDGPIADGDAMLVTGRLQAAPPLLAAPISGTPCAAYFYRMYRVVVTPDSPDEERPVYWGYASLPLTVVTATREIGVVAPRLALPRRPHGGDRAAARARDHALATNAVVRNPQPFFAGDPVLQWMSNIPADENGSARYDWKSAEDVDPAKLELEELTVAPETEVSVHGRWSARRNAIASDSGPGEPPPTLGPPGELGLAAGVPPSLLASWMGTLSTLALGLGLIWFAIYVWPTLK